MIIADRFVWIHFPKCAGSEIENILREHYSGCGGMRFDKIDPANVIWHQTIEEREKKDPSFRLGDRDVISAFRRLPHWLLSRIHFEKARSPDLIITREMFLSGQFYVNKQVVLPANWTARRYTRTPVTHWLRTEHLADDFKSVFSKYFDLRSSDLGPLFKVKNRNRFGYIKDLAFYFTPKELHRLYNANPLWRDLEIRLYGDILHL